MKRRFIAHELSREEEEKEDNDTFPSDNLHIELQQWIVIHAHHGVSHINTVCKQWKTWLDSFSGWLELAHENYATHILPLKPYSFLNERLETLFETLAPLAKCKRRARFCNYIGRLMDTKLKSVLRLVEVEGYFNADQQAPIISSICSYVKEHSPNVLTLQNYHERDVYLNFTAAGHRYYLVFKEEASGDKLCLTTIKIDDNETLDPKVRTDILSMAYGLLSVTGFIGTLFPPFLEDEVITKMMANTKKWNNPEENPYYGMTREDIKAQWAMIRDMASKEGTAMHYNLEMYYSEQKYETDTKEFDLFLNYEKVHVNGKLRAFFTEKSVYCEYLRLCGQVDMLYEYVDEKDHGDGKKHLVLADWKRSKKITMYNSYQSGCVPCTETMGDTNFTHYCIQLCLYKYMLERYYNVIIDAMYLVVLHPNQDNFICIPVDWKMIEPYFQRIVDYRRAYVESLHPLLPDVELIINKNF